MEPDNDDRITNPAASELSFDAVCQRRLSRRDFVKGSAVLAAAGLVACEPKSPSEIVASSAEPQVSNFDFTEIEHGRSETHLLAPDHIAEILLRWGDPIFEDAPEFDYLNQTAEKQKRQFGFNNDYIGYLALPPMAGQQARALLCVNHEYPNVAMMFAGVGGNVLAEITAEQVAVAQASVGASIIEVVQQDGRWQLNKSSEYNRRISALDTEIALSGPVAGNPRLRTSADPQAKMVVGTFNNCAGGMTPWGTYLTCEENFNFHFSGELLADHPETENHKRYNMPFDLFGWGKHDPRFDLSTEPNEPNRFGWVVEIDPLDPTSVPKKRTALGRFKHEGGENVIAPDGRLVVYMGDDQRFEHLYKFVSRDKVVADDRSANKDLLDNGTLYAAKFLDDGRLEWLPLTRDNEVLKAEFASQADILIEPRRAAGLLQATPMDRPEDVVPNAGTGKVYVMLSNNSQRQQVNAANPRANNRFGHIIEVSEPGGDFAATKASWELLVKCGNPAKPKHDAQWHAMTSENGWFASPDNGVIDPSGRLWVSSDQGPAVPLSGTNDGLWAMETDGPLRGLGRMFFRVPDGAEMTGPIFADDGESLFLAVQHPGDSLLPGGARVETATTRWPDFDQSKPPRPAVVVVQRKGGGRVG